MASPNFPLTLPPVDHDPEQEWQALSEQTSRLVTVARAMVGSNRPVDLQGLQHQVGLLCAKALDLPPERTRLARAELQQLASEIDALEAAMRGDPA